MLINGTYYNDTVSRAVVSLLESIRASHVRITITYGDTTTGCAWGDAESGYLSRSTGTTRIPILVYNTRSMGGQGVLDNCIVRICASRGKTELYRHPTYHEAIADDIVTCKLCHEVAPSASAHLHQEDWIGECCWDERLRVTE